MTDYPGDIVREAERLLPDTAFYMHIDRALATSIARNAIAAGMMAERKRCANIAKKRVTGCETSYAEGYDGACLSITKAIMEGSAA